MSKRKTVIELQSKPENKAVRLIVERTKPVEYAPINLPTQPTIDENTEPNDVNNTELVANKTVSLEASSPTVEIQLQTPDLDVKKAFQPSGEIEKSNEVAETETRDSNPTTPVQTSAPVERLRIFQSSTPITRTQTKFQKAAIVVRGENGKHLVELSWRDQMNEKTKDIWNFLSNSFVKAAEELNTNEVSIRKRDILDGSGVKSDRTFISAIYTLEDMGLIEVKRLSGNKEGNIYILTEEGSDEIESYKTSDG